jgi:iron complex outermembrane receptor protein
MLYKKIIPLSLIVFISLYGENIELDTISVESTVITEVAQNAQISADLATALSSSVPSIDMNRRSGIANDIYIRGQKRDNISVEVDGTKIQGACPNRMDPPVSHILANQIDGIEVIEGPYDVENFGTLSGGVKIKTKQPSKDLHAELNFGLGSWDYKKVGATISGGNDIIKLLVSSSYENSAQYKDGDGNTIAEQIDNAIYDKKAVGGNKLKDKYHDMDAYTKKSIMTKAFINTLKNQELRLSYTANRSDEILYGNTQMDAMYDDSNVYSVEYNIKNINKNYKNINLQYYTSDVEHPMATKYRVASNTPAKDNTSHLTTDMQGIKLKNTFLLDGYKFLVGLDLSQRKWDGTYYNTSTGLPLKGNSKSIDNAKTKNKAIFSKLNKTFGNFIVSVGARYDSTDITNDTLESNSYNALGANIITTYNINDNHKVFFGAGTASRVPDARELYFINSKGSEIGTPNLKQTTNKELDLGYELDTQNLNFKIKAFYCDLSDYIYIEKTTSANAFQNIDAHVYGGEISSTYFITDDTTLDAGVSYKRGKKDKALDNQSDTDLADMAPLRTNLALNYEYYNNSIASLEVVSSQKWDNFDEDNGEQELDGWTIINAKVKHSFTKHIEMTVGANNLLDKTYVTSNTYVDLTLLANGGDVMLMNEPGRYIYSNLTLKF